MPDLNVSSSVHLQPRNPHVHLRRSSRHGLECDRMGSRPDAPRGEDPRVRAALRQDHPRSLHGVVARASTGGRGIDHRHAAAEASPQGQTADVPAVARVVLCDGPWTVGVLPSDDRARCAARDSRQGGARSTRVAVAGAAPRRTCHRTAADRVHLEHGGKHADPRSRTDRRLVPSWTATVGTGSLRAGAVLLRDRQRRGIQRGG